MKITRFIAALYHKQHYDKYFMRKDTFNKLGYKAEINNYTASRVN